MVVCVCVCLCSLNPLLFQLSRLHIINKAAWNEESFSTFTRTIFGCLFSFLEIEAKQRQISTKNSSFMLKSCLISTPKRFIEIHSSSLEFYLHLQQMTFYMRNIIFIFFSASVYIREILFFFFAFNIQQRKARKDFEYFVTIYFT